jgi:hypothetical protein
MASDIAFGRRAPAGPAGPAAPPAQDRPLPSLQELGVTARDDRAELESFKRGVRRRRFVSRGGWRWVAGLCFTANGVLGFLDLDAIGFAFGAAGIAALLYSFWFRPRPPAPRETA